MKPEIENSLEVGKVVITALPNSRNVSPAYIVNSSDDGLVVSFTKDAEDTYFRTFDEVFPLVGYTWNFR